MNKSKLNKRNFIYRLIASPFIYCLLMLAHILFVHKRFWHYLKFGGEYINFEQDEKRTILEVYNMLKEIKELKESETK